MKRNTLFVEEPPKVREELKSRLSELSGNYDMMFVGSGADALEPFQNRDFDTVVTELRLSVINGAQLLNEVMDRHPKILRIVLSDLSDLQARTPARC